MPSVFSMIDIRELARTGFDDWQSIGHVKVTREGPLLIFNYTPEAVYKDRWNYFERVSRGLIINRHTGEVVARPFDKFWNVGERGRSIDAPIKRVWEKADGSLGILYRLGGEMRIATRGSFVSDQAQAATEMLQQYDTSVLPDKWTPLFEIIYPENRIVVDYGDLRCLKLLAVRDRFTGRYMQPDSMLPLAEAMGVPVVRHWSTIPLSKVVEWAGQLRAFDGEGFVIETTAGTRWKVKSEDYRMVHRAMSLLSFKNVLERYPERNWIDILPEHIRPEAEGYYGEIESTRRQIRRDVHAAWSSAPTGGLRKEFAVWVNKNSPHLAAYMFAAWDGKPLNSLIKKLAFRDRV